MTIALARLYANSNQTASGIHACSNHGSGVVGGAGAKNSVVLFAVAAEVEVGNDEVSRTVTDRSAGK